MLHPPKGLGPSSHSATGLVKWPRSQRHEIRHPATEDEGSWLPVLVDTEGARVGALGSGSGDVGPFTRHLDVGTMRRPGSTRTTRYRR